MSREDIDRLLAERSLERQAFDDEQVAGFWAKAMANRLDDAMRVLGQGLPALRSLILETRPTLHESRIPLPIQ